MTMLLPLVPSRCQEFRGAFSLRAFPDLRKRIVDPNLSIGISFDLDLELAGPPDEAGDVLGGVFDLLDILVTVEGVGAAEMVDNHASIRVCLRDDVVPSGPELEPFTCCWMLADLARCPDPDQDPNANYAFGELGWF